MQNSLNSRVQVTELQPPQAIPERISTLSVFLAGSIEMGKASEWQRDIINSFADSKILFFNPRRTQWNSGWEQRIEDDNFRKQVNWEISALEKADLIVMYLEPGTLSPVSLIEFGLFARTKKMLVCCPEGYWRKGNIDVVCARFEIETCKDIKELKDRLAGLIQSGFG